MSGQRDTLIGMTIRILVDGRLALTGPQAATRYGLNLDAMRKALSRFIEAGQLDECDETLDGRTKLYPAVPLDKLMRDRPGKGANLRKAAPTKSAHKAQKS